MNIAPRQILLSIIALAILIRLVAAFALGDTALPVSGAYDQVSYDMLAQRVLSGHGFSFPTSWYPFTAPDEQTAHWSFLYALYLAGVYALFGHHPFAARIIQVILSGLHIWLVYRIGRRLFGEWVGVASAILTTFYAYFIFFNAALMTQTFYIIALLAALNLTLTLADDSKSRPGIWNLEFGIWNLGIWDLGFGIWVLLGFALGIAAMMRQTILLFAPLLFAYIWWASRKSRIEVRNSHITPHASRPTPLSTVHHPLITGTLLSLLIIAALILPWTIRNYLVFDDFLLLNSNGGYWLYASNHPDHGTNFQQSYAPPLPDNLKGLNEPALDRALMREGIGFVLADPARFLLLTWSRVGAYFWVAPTEGSLLIANLARLSSFGLYFPLMLYGLWLSRKQWRVCLPLYLYVAFETTFCLLSWAAPRYRLPSDAIMMVFAGLAIVTLAERVGITKRLAAKIPNLKSDY